MDETGFRADILGNRGQKSNDVMLDFRLDFIDAGDVKIPFLPDHPDCFRRDNSKISQFLTGQGFDFQPDPKAVLRFPDLRHLRPRVTWDHCLLLEVAKREVHTAKKLKYMVDRAL